MEQPKEPIKYSEYDKTRALESTIYYIYHKLGDGFSMGLLQEVNIRYDDRIPTACIYYNPKKEEFNVALGTQFFMSLSTEQRAAILLHEVFHFSHGHLFRGALGEAQGKKPEEIDMEDTRVANIAADIAINQYIRNLPEGCMFPEMFKWKDPASGKVSTLPLYKTYEDYYALIQENRVKQPKNGSGQESKDGKDGNDPCPGKDGNNPKGSSSGGPEPYRVENEEKIGKLTSIDSHEWDSLSEEDKKKLLEEGKKVLKRTIEKSSESHTRIPDAVKDLLEVLDTAIKNLDYKGILTTMSAYYPALG
jgi:hypothetical protein